MGLVDVLRVFCLSRVMFDFHANSQPNCTTGWFGLNCKYRCRCTNEGCDTDGQCMGVNICQRGWFGPACQYADLAYQKGDTPEIADEDDQTCVTAASGIVVSLKFNTSHYLTWLRVRFRSACSLGDLVVTYKNNSRTVTPSTTTNMTLDTVTMDIHILVHETIDEISFTGIRAYALCSVYVSGGRNVAMKETAAQSSTYVERPQTTSPKMEAFTADRAVDGNTNQHLYQGQSCSRTNPNDTGVATFSVSFSQPRLVTRYVLYSRVDDRGNQLHHFVSQSADNSSAIVFTFSDNSAQPQPVYTWNHPSVPVVRVVVTNSPPGLNLAICELEVYGDSDCKVGTYGRDCELMCNCPVNVSCYTSTGGCPAGCPAGFSDVDCKTPCESGQFGSGCVYACSDFCAKDTFNNVSCNSTDGTCPLGCVGGRNGPMCTSFCPPNTFGVGCAENCSVNCVKDVIRGETCVHTNGTCTQGCVDGYTGPTCGTVCSHDTYGHECATNCSDFCIKDSLHGRTCLHTDGACMHGCLNGYTGFTCSTKCVIGQFGKDCRRYCSRYCVPSNNSATSSCDHVDGTCLHGCMRGYVGSLCAENLPDTTNYVFIALLSSVFFLIVVALCLPICFWMNRKSPVAEDRGSEELRRIIQMKKLLETSAEEHNIGSVEDVTH